MRIGVISTSLLPTPPKGYGGIERLVAYLVRGLEELGHKVRLYAAEGTDLVPSLGLVTKASEEELSLEAIRDLDCGNTDIILDWSHTKYTSRLGTHNDRVISQVFWTDAKGSNPVYPSRAVQSAFGGDGCVIYPGIDLSQYRIGEKEDYFLYFGRIIPEKGVERVISVARMAGIRLIVAGHTGEMAYDKEYVSMIRSMCNGRIEFVGDVTEDEKLDLLSHAKALLYWGRWLESFGIFIVEALASGTPCIISSSAGGPAEQVKHGLNGFLCGDISDFLDAIGNVDKIDPVKCVESARYFSYKRMSKDWDIMINNHIGGG